VPRAASSQTRFTSILCPASRVTNRTLDLRLLAHGSLESLDLAVASMRFDLLTLTSKSSRPLLDLRWSAFLATLNLTWLRSDASVPLSR